MINGIRMHHDLCGPKAGPTVVLIHGFPLTSALWEPQIKALSDEFRVLTYDLRGMGRSSLGPAPQPLEAYVDDLFALMDHLELGDAALCGLSMGGYIALRAVQRAPDRFWGLALCGTKAEADSDKTKIARAADIKAIRAGGTERYTESMLPKLLSPSSLAQRDTHLKGLLAMLRGNGADGMANALAAMAGRGDTREALRVYPGPVLALAGGLDLLIPQPRPRPWPPTPAGAASS
jgi:pimeloyl-ACP methyl ester carboxylesterase